MASKWDMSPLDADKRIPLKIRIQNSTRNIDDMKELSLDSLHTIGELKFQIEQTLAIQPEHVSDLYIDTVDTDTGDRGTQSLDDNDQQLSDCGIEPGIVVHLVLDDEAPYDRLELEQSNSRNNSRSPLTGAPTVTLTMDASNSADNKQMQTKSENNKSIASQAVSELNVNDRNDAAVHFLTKHSKIQCRVLLVVFEIMLVLFVAYWGTISMLQYGINLLLVLVGWRACRKLHRFLGVCFALFLTIDLLILFVYLVFGLIGKHQSVYGSHGLYIALLSLELFLNSFWFFWYCKFFRAVFAASDSIREIAVKITSKQPILI